MENQPSPTVHRTAIIDPSARLADGVTVEAYAVIGADVDIGAGTWIGPHAVIDGPTRIGSDNRIHAHACLGGAPQDLGFAGERTRLDVGNRNTFREFVTVHRGTPKDRAVTRIGSDNLLMAGSHIGHDCVVGDGIIMANGAMLAGHVEVGDRVNLSGLVAVHQFVRIGRLAMVGGGSIVLRDIPPFTLAQGNRARLFGLNRRGLLRAGMKGNAIAALRRAYRTLYRSGLSFTEAVAELQRQQPSAEVGELLEFLRASKRGVSR